MKVILFDGICNLCNGFVNFIIDHDKDAVFKFAALQSEFAKDLIPEDKKESLETVFFLDGKKLTNKSEAILEIANHLPGFKWLGIFKFIPQGALDVLYSLVAQNRYRLFGKSNSCRIPNKELANRFLA